ncbi:MAG: hypothetical protein SVO26_01220 [Chloroflexota bacterium]|nr:hypothetical protein [Chloroflexota bacterium]
MKIELEPVQRGLQSVRRLWKSPLLSSRSDRSTVVDEVDPVGKFLAAGEKKLGQFGDEADERIPVSFSELSMAELGSYDSSIVEPQAINQEPANGEHGQMAGDLGGISLGGDEVYGQVELDVVDSAPQDAIVAQGQSAGLQDAVVQTGYDAGSQGFAPGLGDIAPPAGYDAGSQGFAPGLGDIAPPAGYDAGSQGFDPGLIDNAASPFEAENDIFDAALMDPAPPAEAEGQASEAVDMSSSPDSQNGDGIDDLLDIFKSEESTDDPFRKIVRELPNVDVYSLLEDVKKVAVDFGITPGC